MWPATARDETANELTFSMLGALEARHAGKLLALGGRQQKAVLALLLVEARGVVSAGRLANELWGERRQSGYVTTLQTYVFHLREVLEPNRSRGAPARVLATVAGGYQLNVDDEAIDARVFERLVRAGLGSLARCEYSDASSELDRALAMWRGDVLADLAEFDFVLPIAAGLAELRLHAAESRIDVELNVGRHASAVAELDRLIERNPLRERLHEQRMLALYRCQRQAEALSAYRDVRALLGDGLGIEPSLALRQLHQAILAQNPDLDWRPAAVAVELSRDAVVPVAAKRSLDRPRSPITLDITLLGELRVNVGATEPVTIRSPRASALLTFLVLHRGAPQRRDRVAGLFWPESTQAQARTNLRRELHTLRAVLPEPDRWLSVDGPTLMWRLDADCHVDLADFEEAAQAALDARAVDDLAGFEVAASRAIQLYRGDFAPGLYEEWLAPVRDRLRRSCVSLLDQLAEVEREAGSLAPAIELARRRIELEPLEEVGYRTLLALQALAGDRAAAVRTYHHCVAVLERELNLAPDSATTAEFERLASGEVLAADGAPPLSPSLPGARSVPLVGRERELHILEECWQHVVNNGAGLAIVGGEAGVGKTRLLDDLVAAAKSGGALVARARCFAAKDRLPLAPVSDWLRSPALRSTRGQLDAVWAREVDRLVPRPDADEMPRPSPLIDVWQRYRFLEGLARAVLVAARPTVLVLDDLQWCDEDTLAWLGVLLRLGENSPLLVLAATRLEEILDNPPVAGFLREQRVTGLAADVELAPLDARHTAMLAAAILGPTVEIDASQMHDETGGYPLFVVESARMHRLDIPGDSDSDQPPRVRAVLSGRIAQASPAAREIAGLAGAVGRDFSLELLIEASDFDVETVVDAVDELWRRRIIREHSATNYDFVHDLLRDTAYGDTGSARRILLHQRIAAAMERLHANDTDASSAGALAEQYERGGQQQLAIPHHIRAAEAAISIFANEQGVRHYRRAADLLLRSQPAGHDRDAAELSIRQAMCPPLNALYGYTSAELQTTCERSIELAERLGDTRQTLLNLIGLFGVRFVQGHIREADEIASRSLDLSQAHPGLAGQAHFVAGGVSIALCRYEQALRHFALAEECSPDAPWQVIGARVDMFAIAWSAHAYWQLGRYDDAVDSAARAIAWAGQMDPYNLAVALAYGAITHQLRGDIALTLDCARRVRELCDRHDIAYYGEWGTILHGWCIGDVEGAQQIRVGISRLRNLGALLRMPYYQSLLAQTLIEAGQLDAAGAVLDGAQATAAVNDDRGWVPELWRLEARRHPGPDGEAILLRAIALAEEQGSIALRGRAANDLASRKRAANASRTQDGLASKAIAPAQPHERP